MRKRKSSSSPIISQPSVVTVEESDSVSYTIHSLNESINSNKSGNGFNDSEHGSGESNSNVILEQDRFLPIGKFYFKTHLI